MVEADRVRERASVEHYEPPVHGVEEPLWVAEDAETNSTGVGRVRAEAVGNLVAVVESHGHEGASHVKVPGRVVRRRWDDEAGPFEWLRDRLF